MPPPTLRDADDTIVLSDLVRTGEASRLRRRGAIRSSHQRVASASASVTASTGAGSRVFYRLFCRGGESGEGQWSHEPFRQELFSSSNKSKVKQPLGPGNGGCGALIHLSATSDPDSTSYTSKHRPAAVVVPLDAVYFRDQRPTATRATTTEDVRSPYPPSSMYSTEVEYFEPTEYKRPEDPFADDSDSTLDSCVLSKNPCGCVTEGVGCQGCGTPLGTRFIPCRAARHSSSHHHHHQSRHTMIALDFTLSRLQEDEGDDEHVEYTFFGDAVDAVAYPGCAHEEPQAQDSDTELETESINPITGRWGRRTSVWMPSDRPPRPRPRPHSYLSSASTFSLLESRDTRDILADFLRRTAHSTSTVYVPPPPPRTRPRPIPRRRTRIGEAEMEESLRRASAVVVEGANDSVVVPTPIPSSPIFIPPEEGGSNSAPAATPPLVPDESELGDMPDLDRSPAPAPSPTSVRPEPEDLDQGLDLPFPFPEDDDPEVTRALGLPWVGFMGTPTEESGFELGVLFDGDRDSDEERQEEDVVVPHVGDSEDEDELDEAGPPHLNVDASEPEEDEEEWRAMMPALRPISDTDEDSDEHEESDSDGEREGDENIPPPPLGPREMDRSALRRHTLPTPPTPPMIPYVPHPGATWDMDWYSPSYSMLSRSVLYNPDSAAASIARASIARRRMAPPFMERSYGSMGRSGEDGDEDEGDDEHEEEEGSKGGAGVLFAM